MGELGEIIIRSLGLGVGLSMDAFAVSMSNGLKENKMKARKCLYIALVFAIFQGIMPFLGYLLGHAFIRYIEKLLPWIALLLLTFLGMKMIMDGVKKKKQSSEDIEEKHETLTFKVLLLQGIATSIDALSTGLTFSNYTILNAILCVSIIAVVTFTICIIGVYIGKKFGTVLTNKADIVGGIVLIVIGLEIFIKGIFF